MKNSNLIICALVLFAFAISGCSVRPMVTRHQRYSGKTGAMDKDGRNSIVVAPTGYVLLFESPIDYSLNPTVGNGHLRRCIRKEANKLAKADDRQSVTQELRYHPEFVEDRKAIVATLEPGRIGVEVLDDGMELYAEFHEFTETHAEHACEDFRQMIKIAIAKRSLYGDTRATSNRTTPEPTAPETAPETTPETAPETAPEPAPEPETTEPETTEEDTPVENPLAGVNTEYITDDGTLQGVSDISINELFNDSAVSAIILIGNARRGKQKIPRNVAIVTVERSQRGTFEISSLHNADGHPVNSPRLIGKKLSIFDGDRVVRTVVTGDTTSDESPEATPETTSSDEPVVGDFEER